MGIVVGKFMRRMEPVRKAVQFQTVWSGNNWILLCFHSNPGKFYVLFTFIQMLVMYFMK